jgi:hypothetical protein
VNILCDDQSRLATQSQIVRSAKYSGGDGRVPLGKGESMRRFNSIFITITLITLAMSLHPTRAQFATPTVNGVIGPGEYGVHTDGQNQQSTGTGQNWYMTWDENNLYVGITNANLGESGHLH